ncbi:MAG TPA: ABC transporter substrate-binding protein [bacterium]|nr:ABC transporter substrate-binding protein [bacterium]
MATGSDGTERISRRAVLRRAAALGLAAGSLSCLGASRVFGAPAGSAVTIAEGLEPLSLDPANDTATMAMDTYSSMFDALVSFDAKIVLHPSLAASWRAVTPTTWEFALASGVMFHNGDPMTSDDVAYSINRIVAPDSKLRRKSFMAGIQKADVVDAKTVRVTTSIPLAITPKLMRYAYVVPRKIVEQQGDAQFALKPVGTGPYQFVEWVKSSHITVRRYDRYWGAAPAIDVATWQSIPEDFSRVAALQTGAADVIVLVPPDRAAALQRARDIHVETSPSLRTDFVGMNTWSAPFADVRVRQAMNYAVDKDTLIKEILGGYAISNGSPVSRAVPSFNPAIKPYPYDPDKAKALLKQAGYANGFETTIEGTAGMYPSETDVIQAIAGQLQKVGVTVRLNLQPWGSFWPRWLGRKVPGLYFLGFGNDLGDPHQIFASHMWKAGRGLYWNTPKLDAMVEAGLATADEAKRHAVYADAQVFVHEQAPWVFLYDQVDIYGVRGRIDWRPRPDEQVLPHQMRARTA